MNTLSIFYDYLTSISRRSLNDSSTKLFAIRFPLLSANQSVTLELAASNPVNHSITTKSLYDNASLV
jgi:hypothetical protein